MVAPAADDHPQQGGTRGTTESVVGRAQAVTLCVSDLLFGYPCGDEYSVANDSATGGSFSMIGLIVSLDIA